MRSVVVVFPASMWAMMPMLRIRSSGVVRAMLRRVLRWGTAMPCPYLYRASKNAGRPRRPVGPVSLRRHPGSGAACCAPTAWDAGSLEAGSRSCWSKRLPPVMREGAVRLRHPVRVFLLLDRLALALRREDHLGGEPLRHVLLAAGTPELDHPAHPPGPPSLPPHFHPPPICRAAHPPPIQLKRRLHVRQRLLEHVHAGLPGALLD